MKNYDIDFNVLRIANDELKGHNKDLSLKISLLNERILYLKEQLNSPDSDHILNPKKKHGRKIYDYISVYCKIPVFYSFILMRMLRK